MSRILVEAFYQAPEAMMITDRAGCILHVNRAFTNLTGFSETEAQGKSPQILTSGRHDKLFYRVMWKELLVTGEWSGEVWDRRKNGEVYPQWLSISALRDKGGKVTNYFAVMSDISLRKDEEQRIAHLANHDPLTGLPNRSLFLDRLANACSRAIRDNERAALLLLDLDRFKLVNDTLGHDAGDQLLRETAGRLLSCVRDTDTVARIGGDEFTIIITDLHETKGVDVVAKKIIATLSEPYHLSADNDAFISASIGIASIPSDATISDSLLKYADIAMYKAKEEGRSTYRYFSEKMNLDVHRSMNLVREIHAALSQDEFDVHYQPIVDIKSGELIGAEALVRWMRTDGSLISAAEFISAAEDSGLIIPIGEAVLDKVVNSLVSWRRAGAPPIRVSINLSRRQLRDSNAFERIRERLVVSNVPPECLEFEISELVLKDETPAVRDSLRKLAGFGIGLAVDNFGTGYTSLQHLRKVPVNVLKIDKLFIRNLLAEDEDAAITDAIIAMAHSLGIRIVAEGVENEEQWTTLRQKCCDFVQGFLISKPLPAKDFLALLRSGESAAAELIPF